MTPEPVNRHAPPRRADVSTVRRYTVATLWALNLCFLATQLVLAVASENPLDPLVLVLALLSVVAAVAACGATPLLLRGLGSGAANHPIVYALVGLAFFTWLGANRDPFLGWAWALPWAFATAVFGCLMTLRWRYAVMGGSLLLLVAIRMIGVAMSGASLAWSSFVATEEVFFAVALGLVLIPATYLTAIWSYDIVVRLDGARQLAAELAVARERLRFATDLHDIQGHNLQVIALKAELAERLLNRDPVAAASELAQVRTIAQAALDDTRAVVNDYRTVTVAVEARNAAAILRSAGVECSVHIDAGDIPPARGTVLGVAIREATTNILRHSRASRAVIELRLRGALNGGVVESPSFQLMVTNDAALPRRSGGTGLTGLTERVEAVGGSVRTTRAGDSFTLCVRIPATDSSPERTTE